MKKILIISLIVFLFLPSYSFGQIITPQNKIPTSDQNDKVSTQIDDLKNRVASRVAELKLVEKRGIIGVVQSATDSQITINDLNDKTRLIDIDELTKFSSSDNNSYGISDIKKGTKISVLGLYNKESERILARFINEITIPVSLQGVITKKDSAGFTLSLAVEDGTTYLVDVERVTKSFAYNNGGLDSFGFTKIETMKNAVVIGYLDPKEKNRITASKIVVFPDAPKNPKVSIIEDSSSPTPAEQSPLGGANKTSK